MKRDLSIVLAAVCSLAASPASAQSPRAGEIEYTIGAAHTFSDSVQGLGGSSINISSRTGIRFGLEYFTSSKLSFGFDATWTEPRYNAVLVPEDGSPDIEASYRATIFTGHLTGTYYLLENALTPFLEAGLGWTHFDSNVADGPPITGCWWDPLWGYICSDFYSTYGATNFSYGAGAGLRWSFGRDRAINAAYRWLEIEADGLNKKPVQESLAIEIVFRF
jgi:opacity protein-like surface antigen